MARKEHSFLALGDEGECAMLMKPPTLPEDYVPAVHADELVKVLEGISRATSPGAAEGHHPQAHSMAEEALRKVHARAAYEAKRES
jgi:uncharacterized protein YjeT (DUF2065 family)